MRRRTFVVAGEFGCNPRLLTPARRSPDFLAEVAPADRELHGRVALSVFAVDDVGPVLDPDVGDLAQGNGLAVRRGHGDLPDRLEVGAVGRQPADDEVEALLALVDLRERLPADGRLDDGPDIADVEAVARREAAVGRDADVRLAEGRKQAQVVDAGDLLHDVDDLAGLRLVHAQVRPHDLDRVLSLHAGHRLLDVVRDVL